MRRFSYVLMLALTCCIVPMAAMAQAKAPVGTPSATKSAPSADMPTDAQIADARSKGMVWTNTGTKVYHKDDQFFGKTKHGKFMTEADAQKAGYKQAKMSPIGKKKTASPSK